MSALFPRTFSPGKIGPLELRNRLIMSLYPTKFIQNNMVTERLVAYFAARARGGVSMIVLDGACLDFPATLKGPIQLRMDTDVYAAGIRKLLDAIQSEGCKAFMQLDYPGAKLVEPGTAGAREHHGMWMLSILNDVSADELRTVIAKIAAGARRAREIGYDGVELQASYGAFISQLLSPLANKRGDEFGGSLENRARFMLETVREIKKAAGADYPLEIKFAVDEHLPGGFSLEEAKSVAKWLEEAGADALLINTGSKKAKNHLLPPHSLPAGVNVDYAAAIKAKVSIPVIAMGKIGSPALAEKILKDGKADFVAMTRALIADPDLPNKAGDDRPEEIRGCIFCLDDCADKGAPGIGRACTVNPFAGLENDLKITPAEKSKRIWVVGGGPAGIQAAIILAQRGHQVDLFEKSGILGGHFKLAHLAPYKEEVAEATRFLVWQLEKSEVKIHKEHEIAVGDITLERPDAVIVAAGSLAVKPAIPGIDLPMVIEARAFLAQKLEAGADVVIIGGGDVGCEVADMIGESRTVAVVEMLEEVLPKMKSMPKQDLLERLNAKNVRVLTSTKAVGIEPDKVVVEHSDGSKEDLRAETVIYAVGSRPENKLAEALSGEIEVYAVGDAITPGNLGDALRSAVRTATQI